MTGAEGAGSISVGDQQLHQGRRHHGRGSAVQPVNGTQGRPDSDQQHRIAARLEARRVRRRRCATRGGEGQRNGPAIVYPGSAWAVKPSGSISCAEVPLARDIDGGWVLAPVRHSTWTRVC